MAEEILVGTSLLPSMIEGGAQLIERLKQDDHAALSAFWMEDEAVLGWKLVIAFTGVMRGNPFSYSKRVLDRAPNVPGLYWPALIRIEDATHPLVNAVKHAVASEYGKQHYGLAKVNLHSTQFSPITLFIYTL